MKSIKPLLITLGLVLIALTISALIPKPDPEIYRLKIIDNKAQITDSEGNVNNIPLDGSLSKLITDINQ